MRVAAVAGLFDHSMERLSLVSKVTVHFGETLDQKQFHLEIMVTLDIENSVVAEIEGTKDALVQQNSKRGYYYSVKTCQ